MNIKLFFLYICLFFFIANNSWSGDEIPIIVISPGKAYQSKSIVGTDVSLISNSDFKRTNEFFLGDVLSQNLNGINYFQQGGHGTVSGIQLRGLPKRYSTVYVDGVKMSDPSSPSNDYYFNHLMTNSIEKIEILKGSQTSLYGSSAIGGTVNIFTKKGKEGHHKNFELSKGSNTTENINLAFDGRVDKYDYFVSVNKFLTDGISAMKDNNEEDKYYSDSIVANFGYNFSNKIRIENYLRYVDSFLEYDEVQSGRLDINNTDDQEGSYSLRLIRDDGKLKNTLSYNNTYFRRSTSGWTSSKDLYVGNRDAFNLLGEYNFSLDTKIVYGLDNEFDKADFTTWAVSGNQVNDEAIYSQYVDLQYRPTEKLYSTIGFRRDNHTTAGAYETSRITFAYKPDGKTKFRSSFGTGIRFPSLNDYFYDTNVQNKEDLSPEKSKSFDFGVEKIIEEYNINLNLTFFKVNYDDNISNWEGNTDRGKTPGGSVIQNSSGKIESKGFEISSEWKPQKDFFLVLGYTLTDAYDGEDCDDPDYAKWQALFNQCLDEMPVRVPRHSLNASLNKKFSNKFSSSLLIKYAGERRDYGNANNGYNDVLLSDYTTVDFFGNYNIHDNYNIYFSAKNLLDYDYEEAFQYSTMGRTVNFGLKRKF